MKFQNFQKIKIKNEILKFSKQKVKKWNFEIFTKMEK